jgi:hypothetical protein
VGSRKWGLSRPEKKLKLFTASIYLRLSAKKICENLREILQRYKHAQISGEFPADFF